MEIQLKSITKIKSVTLYPTRTSDHLTNLEIRAGLDLIPDDFLGEQLEVNQVCGTFAGPGVTGEKHIVECLEDTLALFVTVQRLENGILSLKQLDVDSG